MFDKISDAAEKLATHVSRRAFLGRLGPGALGLAAVIGGVLAYPAHARASGQLCCLSNPLGPSPGCVKAKQGSCPAGWYGPVNCKDYSFCPG
jgi:hypothetical protein